MNWEEVSAIATAIGAVGQIATALLSVCIAIFAYIYTKKQAKLNLMLSLTGMWNAQNYALIQNPQCAKFVDTFRTPVRSAAEDAMIFTYLNTYEIIYMLYRDEIISRSVYDNNMANAASTVGKISREELDRYFSRGYDPEFRKVFLEEHLGKSVR